MHTSTTVQPGQRGAKKLAAQYGDRLVCVRYRCDAQRQKRVKTIELIVEEWPWTSPPSREDERAPRLCQSCVPGKSDSPANQRIRRHMASRQAGMGSALRARHRLGVDESDRGRGELLDVGTRRC